MRAAAYGRHSGDLQNPLSTEDQIRSCKEFAEREGFGLVKVYTDPAISGFTILQRPGINQLMQDARNGAFDVVIAEGLDRISRDPEDTAGLFKRLRFLGIKIVTIQEGEISSLHVGFKGTMNAVFLDDLKIKVKRGLRGRVESGRSGGGNCYGYDVVRNIDSRGELIRGERVINAAEAKIVVRIFEEYVAGKSPKAIASKLNKEGVPAPTASKWAATTIYGNWQRGTGILNNEMYVGLRVWNKVSYPKSPDTGRHTARINPESQHVRAEVPELRIVPQELWDRVKMRQQASRKVHKPFWKQQRPRYIFSYLLKCGCCGSGMAKISKTHYGCSAVRNKGDAVCTNRRGVRQDELENTVLALLKERLMDPALLDVFCKEYAAHLNRLRIAQNSSLASYKAELAKLQGRQKRIIKAVMDGYDTPGMKDESNAIHAREQELTKLLSVQKETPVLLHPNMAQRYREEITALTKALRDEKFGQEAVDLVRSLIDKIVLTPDEDGDGLLINLYGDLAGIAKIASGKTQFREEEEQSLRHIRLIAGLPEVSEPLFSSVPSLQGKMVAGVRSHLDLHSIKTSTPSRTGSARKGRLPIMQGKMVGPAGLEPATRPL
ncbi:recombinase family protein [Bradyrhizobium betae]|uniref:recombinase family protein n=1 Tax=Bradyrhizobium betae TaxID=244734 RepID=UPI003D672E50